MYPICFEYVPWLENLPNKKKNYPVQKRATVYEDRTARVGFSFMIYDNAYYRINHKQRLKFEKGANIIWENPPTESEVRDALEKEHKTEISKGARMLFNELHISDKMARSFGSYYGLNFAGKIEINFVPTVRLSRMLPNDYWMDDITPIKASMNMSVGRFLRKIHPDATDAEIEVFVDKCKAVFYANKITIEEIDDERILWAYDEENYDHTFDLGRLANSCMRGSVSQSRIQFYVDEPKASLLIAHRKVGGIDKVVGRAVIWNLDNGKRVMNYIYAGGSVISMMESHAKENGIEPYPYLYEEKDVVVTCETPLNRRNGLPSLDSMVVSSINGNKIHGYN